MHQAGAFWEVTGLEDPPPKSGLKAAPVLASVAGVIRVSA
jgi:hypothetical protein